VEHRIADGRMIRLIRKWLKAGVMVDGEWSSSEAGTPQGAVVSPTLANIYLHYSFDLWAVLMAVDIRFFLAKDGFSRWAVAGR
jgi:retron-type reverse transcriptase